MVLHGFGPADEEGLLFRLRKHQRQSQVMQSNWSSIVAGNERLNYSMNNEPKLFAEPQPRGEIPTCSYDFNFSLRCSDEVASLIKVDPSLVLSGVLENIYGQLVFDFYRIRLLTQSLSTLLDTKKCLNEDFCLYLEETQSQQILHLDDFLEKNSFQPT